MSNQVNVTVRMYRLNELGDCFLLSFASGSSSTRMLIDCGSFRNGAPSVKRLEEVVGAIKKDLKGQRLDVVIGTHQHNDHLSGFVHCEKAFRNIGVDEVWLSWLDDPKDATARTIGKDHNNLRLQLADARDALTAITRARQAGSEAARSLESLNDALRFFGAGEPQTPPEMPANAIKVLKTLGKSKPRYLKPGRSLDLPGLPSGAVKVHVLGPPREHDLLYRKDPRTGESYDHSLVAAGLMATKFLEAATKRRRASRDEAHYPFNDHYKVADPAGGSRELKQLAARYRAPADAWRTIDDDWMQQAETLALFLDTYTNNSSLVLAIELVDSGKVLLFAADAQTGNWLSWPDVKWQDAGVTTEDILARTVFYKVGHHASHNATLVGLFEKMTHPDLVALIPVHKKDANIKKKDGWKMPARNLFKRIVEKTEHRVLQMDNVNPADCDPAASPANAAWKRVGITPRITPLSIELDIVG